MAATSEQCVYNLGLPLPGPAGRPAGPLTLTLQKAWALLTQWPVSGMQKKITDSGKKKSQYELKGGAHLDGSMG